MLFAEKSVDGSGFIFLSGKSKNQGPGLLGTVGGGLEKCAEFLARMIQKYGDVVLGEIEERNAQLQGK